ncbi:DUF3298 and DUF4163 domain-containing protein [Parapedobacter lycopersici]|uniref:DUF3298 and DUF4163 domain-containing protein n=1 Tax=Parapedobacter lycopersici TaxID=1864939 RepID=UPI00333EDF7F
MKKNINNTGTWLLLFCLTILSGCQPNSGDGRASDNKRVATDTLTYQYTDYTRFSDHLVKTSETTDTTFFSVSYPVFADSTVNLFVREALLGSDTASVEKAADQFISDFDRFMETDPFPRVWVSESHAKVYRITPSYLGLTIDAYSYTGGAHGNYATVFGHYDLTDGQPFTLSDVVDTAYQNELTAVAERYFRQQESLTVDQSLEDHYFFDDGRFSIPANFAFEQDSLLFLYNIYEIKPYVDGQTELRVPYTDIDRLLTDRARRIVNEIATVKTP